MNEPLYNIDCPIQGNYDIVTAASKQYCEHWIAFQCRPADYVMRPVWVPTREEVENER